MTKIFSVQFELPLPERDHIPPNAAFEQQKENDKKRVLGDLEQGINTFVKSLKKEEFVGIQWLQTTTVNTYGSFVQLTAIVTYTF